MKKSWQKGFIQALLLWSVFQMKCGGTTAWGPWGYCESPCGYMSCP